MQVLEITSFPEEILNIIYGYLPIKDLLRVEETSKFFKGISLRPEVLAAKKSRLIEIENEINFFDVENNKKCLLIDQLLFGSSEGELFKCAIENLLPKAFKYLLHNLVFTKKLEEKVIIDLLDKVPEVMLARKKLLETLRNNNVSISDDVTTKFLFSRNKHIPYYRETKKYEDKYNSISDTLNDYLKKAKELEYIEEAEKKAIEEAIEAKKKEKEKAAEKLQAEIKNNFFSFLGKRKSSEISTSTYETEEPARKKICVKDLRGFAKAINQKLDEMSMIFSNFKPNEDTKQLITTTTTLIEQLFNVYKINTSSYLQYASAERSSLFINEDDCELFLEILSNPDAGISETKLALDSDIHANIEQLNAENSCEDRMEITDTSHKKIIQQLESAPKVHKTVEANMGFSPVITVDCISESIEKPTSFLLAKNLTPLKLDIKSKLKQVGIRFEYAISHKQFLFRLEDKTKSFIDILTNAFPNLDFNQDLFKYEHPYYRLDEQHLILFKQALDRAEETTVHSKLLI